MEDIIRTTVQQEVVGAKLTAPRAVELAMHCVELWSQHRKLTGDGKRATAKQILPAVFSEAVAQRLISPHKAAELEHMLLDTMDLADDMIAAFVEISKNPAFIQIRDGAEQLTRACATGCRKKQRSQG